MRNLQLPDIAYPDNSLLCGLAPFPSLVFDLRIVSGKIMILIKRVYEAAKESDGRRILVDRLWPRGISKEKAKIDFWAKELAPSNELRRWYGHDPDKWSEFKNRYFEELKNKDELLEQLMDFLNKGKLTFVYSSKEQQLNNAEALKEYIERKSLP